MFDASISFLFVLAWQEYKATEVQEGNQDCPDGEQGVDTRRNVPRLGLWPFRGVAIVHLPEGTANDEKTQTSMKIILRRAANPVLLLDEVNNTTKGALDDIENDKSQSKFLVISTEVSFACLLNDGNTQCESNSNKSTSERPLEDPVGGEPNASGDPSPGKANEDRAGWKNEKEGRGHNYGVDHERPLGAGEGYIIAATTACSSVGTEGELHNPHIVVLGEGTARV